MSTKLTNEASIPQILSEMSVEEKLLLLTGSTTFRGGCNEEHGIPAPLFLDGGTGFNTMQMGIEATFLAVEEKTGTTDPQSIDSPMGGFAAALGGQALADPARIGELICEVHHSEDIVGCYPPGMLFGATMNPEVISLQ